MKVKGSTLNIIVKIALGVLFLAAPYSTINTVIGIVGIVLMVNALLGLVTFFSYHAEPMDIINLLITIVFGVLGYKFFRSPAWFLNTCSKIFGIYLIFNGLLMLFMSSRAQGMLKISALATLILGVFILAKPFTLVIYLIRVIGAALMVSAVSDVLWLKK